MNKIIINQILVTILFLTIPYVDIVAQPVFRTRKMLGNYMIYQDYKIHDLYYYAPGKLRLEIGKNGKPEFQLLQMRYTGRSATADKGEVHFMNVVQFTVKMQEFQSADMERLKSEIADGEIKLRPLPIRNIDAFLVAPLKNANHGAYKRIGDKGSFQADDKDGISSNSGYWKIRTFTVRLDKHEAQMVWDQVESGQLSLSLGYAYYADLIKGNTAEVKAAGDSAMVNDFNARSTEILKIHTDTIPTTSMIHADAFPIRVDVEKWPELIKRIDLNEGVPPAYAALEVRCYDFKDDLRPDLSMKSIEVQATGVGGQPIILPAKRFVQSRPDLHTLQLHFPYAVEMTHPYRYRISEYGTDGAKKTGEWITRDSWTELLDVTTPLGDNDIEEIDVDVEVDWSSFVDNEISKVSVGLTYVLGDHTYETFMDFSPEDALAIQSIILRHTEGTEIRYNVRLYKNDGERNLIKEEKLTDNYIYIQAMKGNASTDF